MNTKQLILDRLNKEPKNYFSGQELADELSISRTAVWKAIRSLQKDGHEIIAQSKLGYCLNSNLDVLTAENILELLSVDRPLDIKCYETVGSTNDLIKNFANQGAGEGLVVIANTQSRGRGRRGRSFYSPAQSGLYMSILLKPIDWQPSDARKITTIAAVATAAAIEQISGRATGIKWVNDILIENKKVAGILTEASLSMESGSLDYVVLGIGVNVYQPKNGFPDEINEIAGYVLNKENYGIKNKLAACILNDFFSYYNSNQKYIDIYRSKNVILGKEIWVLKGKELLAAKALAIDDDCSLLVAYADGSREKLSSGEISIRMRK